MDESPADGAGAAVVTVQTPADSGYMATLRLAAASLAARCELTIDEVEDVRLAIDEAYALLLPHASPGATLDTRFQLVPYRLEFSCSVSTVASEVERDGLGWAVLSALASDVAVSDTGGTLTISVVKQRAASPA